MARQLWPLSWPSVPCTSMMLRFVTNVAPSKWCSMAYHAARPNGSVPSRRDRFHRKKFPGSRTLLRHLCAETRAGRLLQARPASTLYRHIYLPCSRRRCACVTLSGLFHPEKRPSEPARTGRGTTYKSNVCRKVHSKSGFHASCGGWWAFNTYRVFVRKPTSFRRAAMTVWLKTFSPANTSTRSRSYVYLRTPFSSHQLSAPWSYLGSTPSPVI